MATEKRLTRSRVKEFDEVSSACKKLKKSNESTHDTDHSSSSDVHNRQEIPESAAVTRQLPKMTNEADTTIVEKDAMTDKHRDDKEKTGSAREEMSDQQRTLSADNKQSIYRIKSMDKVNIKLRAHRAKHDSPDVWSMCILESGDVLLADYTIPVLSMLDHKTYTVQPVLSLPTTSHSVCKVNTQEVVVGLSNQTLQFVSIQDQFVLTRSIQLEHICLSIDVVLDQIYVTDGKNGNIFIYDLNGKTIKKIENEPNGNKIFSWNRFIIVSEGGDTMHVTDRYEGVMTLDREGNVIWGYTVPGTTEAFGICKDGEGNLFVTGRMSNNVALVGQDGAYQGEVIPSERCVARPKAVCFDRLNSKLYVSGGNCDEIYVYTFH